VYKDREEAGKVLAKALSGVHLTKPLVLGIPRGGVVVAREVAKELGADLGIVMSKKIGAPFNPEFAVAAVDPDGEVTWPIHPVPEIDAAYIEREAAVKKEEIQERLRVLRGQKGDPPLLGRTIVLVDDGIATGLTVLAALKYARRKGAERVILATPVAPTDTVEELEPHFDMIVCPLRPRIFYAVGEWYSNFGQVTDEEVLEILRDIPPKDARAKDGHPERYLS